MKTLTVKVPEAMEVELEAFAQERGERRSLVVREALGRYLKGERHLLKGSVLDRVKDLVGSLKGPRDLSVNKDYLKGFGE